VDPPEGLPILHLGETDGLVDPASALLLSAEAEQNRAADRQRPSPGAPDELLERDVGVVSCQLEHLVEHRDRVLQPSLKPDQVRKEGQGQHPDAGISQFGREARRLRGDEHRLGQPPLAGQRARSKGGVEEGEHHRVAGPFGDEDTLVEGLAGDGRIGAHAPPHRRHVQPGGEPYQVAVGVVRDVVVEIDDLQCVPDGRHRVSQAGPADGS
jgi:hypothetical protein